MSLIPLLTELQEVLFLDADIKVFTQEKYTKDPKIFLGISAENPPVKADLPFIVIFSVSRSRISQGDKTIFYDAEIGCAIENEAITIDTRKNKI